MNRKIFIREPYDMHMLDEIGEQWAIITLRDNSQERLFIGGLILLMILKLARM